MPFSSSCRINLCNLPTQKVDPDFKLTLTLHHAFLSVESQLDSLHQPSSLAVEVKETDFTQPYLDGYWSESVCDAQEMHESNTSTSTCSL